MKLWQKVATTLEMIKWEHSVFALPFALTAAMLAIFWIVVCMVLARSAGMAFNRWADAELDGANSRTNMRAIPAGLLSREFVGWFTLLSSILFLLAASRLNRLTLCWRPPNLPSSCFTRIPSGSRDGRILFWDLRWESLLPLPG
jgi:4-hydroxybenzoate polyprenyltransferase